MHIFRQWALPPGCPVVHRLADGDTCLGLLAAYDLPGGLQQLYDLNTGRAWAACMGQEPMRGYGAYAGDKGLGQSTRAPTRRPQLRMAIVFALTHLHPCTLEPISAPCTQNAPQLHGRRPSMRQPIPRSPSVRGGPALHTPIADTCVRLPQPRIPRAHPRPSTLVRPFLRPRSRPLLRPQPRAPPQLRRPRPATLRAQPAAPAPALLRHSAPTQHPLTLPAPTPTASPTSSSPASAAPAAPARSALAPARAALSSCAAAIAPQPARLQRGQVP